MAPLGTLADIGLVTLLAVLLSPIAWLYYFTLAFPAWVATLARPVQRALWLRGLLLVARALRSGDEQQPPEPKRAQYGARARRHPDGDVEEVVVQTRTRCQQTRIP